MADSTDLADFDDVPMSPVDPGTAKTLDRARKLEKQLLAPVIKKCHSLVTKDVPVGGFGRLGFTGDKGRPGGRVFLDVSFEANLE